MKMKMTPTTMVLGAALGAGLVYLLVKKNATAAPGGALPPSQGGGVYNAPSSNPTHPQTSPDGFVSNVPLTPQTGYYTPSNTSNYTSLGAGGTLYYHQLVPSKGA